jgi:hypothetical protein
MARFRIRVSERSAKAKGVAQSSEGCDNPTCMMEGAAPRSAQRHPRGGRKAPLAPLGS